MIQVQVKDMNGTECQIGDLVCFHYPNPKIKSFYVLTYNEQDMRFEFSDLKGGQETKLAWMKMERLCPFESCKHTAIFLGKVHARKVKDFEAIFSITNRYK